MSDKEYMRTYYLKNKDKVNKYHRERYKLYPHKWGGRNQYYKEYHIQNLEDRKEYQEQYRGNHIKERQLYNSIYWKRTPGNKLRRALRSRMYAALKGLNKSAGTMKLLGVSDIETVKLHLESQFKPGMTWENHGTWHIDHKVPIVSFDLTKPEEQQKAFHYTNLQPLWALENLTKRHIIK